MYTKVHKIDESLQKTLDQTTKTFSKKIRAEASLETVKYQTQVYLLKRQ